MLRGPLLSPLAVTRFARASGGSLFVSSSHFGHLFVSHFERLLGGQFYLDVDIEGGVLVMRDALIGLSVA